MDHNSSEQQPVHLGAFGKHPGWDDHIDDIGVETADLVTVKRILYVQGIGGNIDAGAWVNLESSQRLDEFDHEFLWRTNHSLLAGRLWSSVDGKGRARYPMVVCADCADLPVEWAVQFVFRRLKAVQQQCEETKSAAVVQSALEESRSQLRSEAVTFERPTNEWKAWLDAIGQLADHEALGPNRQGFHRIMYQMRREMSPYLHPENPVREDRGTSILRPLHMRVPLCASEPEQASRIWMHFLSGQLDPSTPFAVIAPIGQAWIDLLVGTPTAAQLFCMKATEESLPLTTDIPYTIDEAFMQTVDGMAEAASQGVGAAPSEVPVRGFKKGSLLGNLAARLVRGRGPQR